MAQPPSAVAKAAVTARSTTMRRVEGFFMATCRSTARTTLVLPCFSDAVGHPLRELCRRSDEQFAQRLR